MGMQFRMVSKEEAHRLIDEAPGNRVMVLTYDNKAGISDTGRYVRKKKGKLLVDKANVLVLSESNPIMTLNLHDRCFGGFSYYNREKIDRSILFPRLE